MKRGQSLLVFVLAAGTLASDDLVEAGILWREDLTKAIAEARKRGTDVFVYISTPDCGPCRLMESETFANEAVQKLLRGFVCVRLKNAGDAVNKIAIRPVAAFPTCLIVRDGKGRIQLPGFLPPELFLYQLQATRKALSVIDAASKKIRHDPANFSARLRRGRAYRTIGDYTLGQQDARFVADSKEATRDQRGAAEFLALDIDVSRAGVDAEDDLAWKKLEDRFKLAEGRIKGSASEGELHIYWSRALVYTNRAREAREHLKIAMRLPKVSDEVLREGKKMLRALKNAEESPAPATESK